MFKSIVPLIGLLLLLTGCFDDPEATLEIDGKVIDQANVTVTVDGKVIEDATVHIDGEILVTVKEAEKIRPKVNKKPSGVIRGNGKKYDPGNL